MDKRAKWCLFIRRDAKGAKKNSNKKNTLGCRNETQYSLRLKVLNPLCGFLFHCQIILVGQETKKDKREKNKGIKKTEVHFFVNPIPALLSKSDENRW